MFFEGDHVIINYFIHKRNYKGIILKESYPRYYVEFKDRYTVKGYKTKRWLSSNSLSLDKEATRKEKINKIVRFEK